MISSSTQPLSLKDPTHAQLLPSLAINMMSCASKLKLRVWTASNKSPSSRNPSRISFEMPTSFHQVIQIKEYQGSHPSQKRSDLCSRFQISEGDADAAVLVECHTMGQVSVFTNQKQSKSTPIVSFISLLFSYQNHFYL